MVTVDFQALIPPTIMAMVGGDAFIQQLLDDVASSARAKWITLAQRELRSSKRDYINGIQGIEAEGAERSISLVGWLANMVESGMSGFDLRRTLLQNTRSGTAAGARVSKSGHRYRAIPFRHGTPGSRGQAGPPMGSRYGPQGEMSLAHPGGMDRSGAAELGKRIYSMSKGLKRGERLGAGHAPRLAEHHRTDIYAGMRKVRAVRSGPVQEGKRRGVHTQYQTFRTISEANSTGWIHPGIKARHFIPQVEEHVRKIVPATIEAALKAALGGL